MKQKRGNEIGRRSGHGPAPLSFAQRRLWLLDGLVPAGVYSMPLVLALTGPQRVPELVAALGAIVERHEVLRTVFRVAGEEPTQHVRPEEPLPVPLVELSGLAPAAGAAEAARVEAEEAGLPFDLAAGPLVRARLLRLGETSHRLTLNTHHIVSDGWSVGRILAELAALLEGRPLAELPIQYADYAAWEQEHFSGARLAEEIGHWRGRLTGLEPLELPGDRPRPPAQSFAGGVASRPLADGLAAALVRLARGGGATLFMAGAAGFLALLARYTGRSDVAVGTPVAGRTRREVEDLVGLFVNTLVLRADLSGDPPFAEALERVRAATVEAFEHQQLPFDRLVEELAPERDLARSPVVQVLFALEDLVPKRLTLCAGLTIGVEEAATATAKLDLSVTLSRSGDTLSLGAQYARDLFDGETVDRLLGHLACLLAAAAERPETRLSDLPLFGAAERAQLLAAGQGRPAPAGLDASLAGLVEAQVRRTPDAVAVVDETRRLSYAELDRAADRLARSLVGAGVGPETLVGVALERSVDLVAALLAVLKAGGAYVPLDPGYPAERLAWMREDAGLALVLTEAWLAGASEGSGAEVRPLPGGERLAYVIYTSGTTGRPKGAMVTQRAAVNHMLWMQGEFPLHADDRVLQKTPISFDASVWEFWAPLQAGATVVMARPGSHRDPAELAAEVERFEVTVLQLVPTLLQALLGDGRLAGCRSLRRIFCGGEALSAEVVRAYAASPLSGRAELVNLYGPTETAIDVTSWRCRSAGGTVLLGRPIDNVRLEVLDAGGALAPWGAPGELAVGGAAVGRGYWRRPAETAERFVPDRTGEPGARIYRTGDQVRWVGEGELAYLGRLDQQVKVRGVRIELGEIEAALARHPEVAGAAVLVRDDEALGRRLVAYVAAPGEAPPVAALVSFLADRLPETMIPSAWVVLGELPLLPNGKLDRRALAAIAPERGPEPASAEPRGPLEELVAGLFADLLGVESVGRETDFFRLGGHSLLATRLVSRLRQACGVPLTLRAVFERPTVAGLAAAVAAARAEPGPPAKPLRRRAAAGPAPLSFAQQRLWVLERLVPKGLGLYNVPLALALNGELDLPLLAGALGEIVRRHEVLRTSLPLLDGEPVQVVRPAAPVPVPLVDLAGLASEEAAREAKRIAAEEAVFAFDLEAGPLVRCLLVRRGPASHTLLLILHHVVADGWSLQGLLAELAALLEGRALAELEVQYGDWAVWQREALTGERLEAQLAYWRRQLSGLAPFELPSDRPRPVHASYAGGSVEGLLSAEVTASLERASRSAGATLFMTLAAAFSVLLSRLTGRWDLAVGTPVAGRPRPEVEGLIGFFVNTLVLRSDLGGDPPFADFLVRFRETALGAYDHQEIPFDRLVEELAPERDLSRTPLTEVTFALHEQVPRTLCLGSGLVIGVDAVATGTAKFDLSLDVERSAEGAATAVEYATDLFDRVTAERLLGCFETLVGALGEDPSRRLSEVPLLAPAERGQLLAWEREEAPPVGSVVARIAARAASAPSAVAVEGAAGRLTYGEIMQRSAALAGRLAGLGVGPDEVVGLALPRSLEQIVALLGILRAGGAYLPLDPALPGRRLAAMIADARVRVAVADGREEALAGVEHVVKLEAADGRAPEIACEPAQLAYVLYTSGSTGRPKGVGVPLGALSHHAAVLAEGYGITSADRVLQLASLSFDASGEEIYPCLACGATLVLRDEDMLRSMAHFLAEVERLGLTVLDLPTALWHELVAEMAAEGLALPRSVRLVVLGGEQARADRLEQWRSLVDGRVRLVNTYGPTEATIVSTWRELGAEIASREVPIGRPIPGARAWVTDRGLEPAPPGMPGELALGGAGLARGYLGRPDLTAERFVPDPFSGLAGERLYRSGDLVRLLPDGELEFRRRVDAQVKLRGFRVEPGEVEAVLHGLPGVSQAVAAVREDAPGELRLVAYAVGEGLDPAVLRAGLSERLPAYMVPSAVVVLAELPRAATGKIDRRALPAPEWSGERERVEPRTAVERRVADVWAEVLKVERPGVHDSFWELGGHSLLAARVLARVRTALGVELPLQSLFEKPTLGAFASEVDKARSAGGPAILPGRGRTERPPLSFAQERLWLLDRIEPGNVAWNLPFSCRLKGPLDENALRTSLAEIVRRQESLRTRFAEEGGIPYQVIEPVSSTLPRIDLRGLDAATARSEGERLAGEVADLPFALERGPLLRTVLVEVGHDDHLLLLVAHHIVADGWSIDVFWGELGALYAAFVQGAASPLPEPPIQYADFAAWQREHLQGEALATQVAFWRDRLAGAPPALELPTDRLRPAVPTHRGGVTERLLPAELSSRLHQLARARGASLFMVLAAGFDLLLSRLAGQDDVVIGSPAAGRERLETEELIGFFLNTLVLRTDLSGDPSFADLLARVREGALAAFRHQDVPFERLLAELSPDRQLSRAPVFQVLLNMVNLELAPAALSGLAVEPLAPREPAAKLDWTLYVHEEAGRIVLQSVHDADLFDRPRFEEMLRQLEGLFVQAVAHPEAKIGDLSLVTPHAASLLPDPSRALPDDWHGAVHEHLSRHAGEAPGRPAVTGARKVWTYGEVEALSNRVAQALLARGVEKGDVVALWAHRDPSLVWAATGILKAGAVMMILDPAYPEARLLDYLEIGRPAAWIAVDGAPEPPEAVRKALPLPTLTSGPSPCQRSPSSPAWELRGGSGEEGRGGEGREGETVGPDDPACLTFTSGSTGKPKAVVGRHGPLTHFYPFMAERFGLSADDRFGMLSALSHDPLQRDLFTPLCLGAALAVPDPEQLGNPGYLADWVRDEGVTVLHLTPAMMDLLTQAAERSGPMPSLRRAFVVGDVLRKSEVERLYAVAPGLACCNLYGSTETQRSVAFLPVPRGGASGRDVLPVGRGMAGTELLILARSGRLAGVGELGEIAMRGPHLAQGYLGDPELTAARFVANPFGGGDRLYRTGDLGRFLPDGNPGHAEVVGRADSQVKIRGFRVEPGEIEAALRREAGVEDCVALVREGRLVAYVVGAAADPAHLRAALARRLPDYMVPTAFVALPALPLTRTGKVDRRALPAPLEQAAGEQEELSPSEELLAAIWAELLGREWVGAADGFFDLGGHSLLATRMVSRVRDVLGVEVPLRALFEEPTLAGFARRIERHRGAAPAPPLTAQPRGASVPLSFAQQRLWVLHLLQPRSSLYNVPAVLHLSGRLDPRVFLRALTEIVRRHETLRTVLALEDDEPVQVVLTPAPAPLPLVDLSGLGAATDAEADRLTAEEMARPFELTQGPLFRAALVRLAAEEHRLLVNLHHLVADGWSIGVLLRELAALVRSYAAGEPSPLADLAVQYADFTLWQRQWLSAGTAGALDAQLAYWRGQLAGVPPLELPADHPRPRIQTGRGALAQVELPAALLDELEHLSRRRQSTLFMTLLAAFEVLLARWSGQEDFAVGAPIAGRTRSEIESLIGFFVNTLVLRADLAGEPMFSSLLDRVRETALAAYAHQDVTFERVVEELAPDRDLSRSPLFQVAFALQSFELPELDFGPALSVAGEGKGDPTSKFDLSLYLARSDGGGLACIVEHTTDLFDAATVHRLLGHWETLLAAAVAEPRQRIDALPLLTEAERRQLAAWNTDRPDEENPADSERLHDLVLAQAARTPEAVALIDGEVAWTYAELAARVLALAVRLRELGVGPEVPVGVHLGRSAHLVVGLLGTLAAGGFYVPLDPGYPSERLAFMVEDSGCQILVTERALAARIPARDVVLVDEPWQEKTEQGESAGDASNLAYLIYTSGSTGRPKAVAVTHKSAVLFVRWAREVFSDRELAGVLAATSIAFDLSVFELFVPLAWGGTVILAQDALALPVIAARERVRLINTVPSAVAELVGSGGLPRSVVTVNLAGEALPRSLADQVYAQPGVERLLNLYGPSEDTTYSTWAVVERQSDRAPAIGGPVHRTAAHVVDRRGELLPVGVPGELLLGGDGLARGYLGRPELTAERFVPDPFAARPGARLYRTGDLARRRADGVLEYLGRLDHQVKLRGFRIELGEIESELRRLPGVGAAVVLLREDEPGDRRLVAYLVTAGEAEIDSAEARESLRRRLPEHMVPGAFVTLPTLPLSPNGKVDRKALPAPGGTRQEEGFVAPRTPLEEQVAAVWAEVLKLDRVGLHDRFWDLGGHSLLATKVLVRLRHGLGVDLPLQTLFEHPTLEAFATAVGHAVLAGHEDEVESLLEQVAALSEEEILALLEQEK